MTSEIKASKLISTFANHKNAANLLMIVLLAAGLISVFKLNNQFFPTLSTPEISVSISWPGTSAEDIKNNIIDVLEPELRFLDGLEEISSAAIEGIAGFELEFYSDADMTRALSDVQRAVDSVNLPQDSEDPKINRNTFYEGVARIIIAGDVSEATLQNIAYEIRDELLDVGVAKVDMLGSKQEEIVIEVSDYNLQKYGLTINQISDIIKKNTNDNPSGTLEGAIEKQIRTRGSNEDISSLGEIELFAKSNGEKILIKDIMKINRAYDKDAVKGVYKGKPAIRLVVRRSTSSNTIETLDIFNKYFDQKSKSLPKNIIMEKYDVRAEHLISRINLLLKNGAGGLILVLMILFIFLNWRIAIWVALGIPIAFGATLTLMLLTGQSINMISLFALILTLGIIVDDAIVVGEHTSTLRSAGYKPLEAAELGAVHMLSPIFAASLTTIASFLPTMIVGGRIGEIMFVMPLVVISVLAASLVECFLILPGHLKHSLHNYQVTPHSFRDGFDRMFFAFRDGPFKKAITLVYNWRYAVIALAVSILMISVTVIVSGKIRFQFFPSPEPDRISAGLTAAAGTPRLETEKYTKAVLDALYRAEKKLLKSDLGGGSVRLIENTFITVGRSGNIRGDNAASINVQLLPSEQRDILARDIVRYWKQEIPQMAGIEQVSLIEARSGPRGSDINLTFSHNDINILKKASLEFQQTLSAIEGVSGVVDDLPYGKQEIILELTPRGSALNLDIDEIGKQLRAGFEGTIVKRFPGPNEEMLVRISREGNNKGIQALREFYIKAPNGIFVPLLEAVKVTEQQGHSIITVRDGKVSISITADVNAQITSAIEVTEELKISALPNLEKKYGLTISHEGRAKDRMAAFSDLRFGAILALVLIYIILAWVFASYSLPIIVMLIIPFGAVGAILGHLVMGFNLSILSFIGLLGLIGILVNNSIILVTRMELRIKHDGDNIKDAVIGASCDRLRAVILTTLTTIGGLTPLMFETSMQAQFLLPMAITIVFGLGMAALLVLVIVPASIGIKNDLGTILLKVLGWYMGKNYLTKQN